MEQWLASPIQRGDQTGSRYVYPTINLDPAVLPAETQRGVYASLVRLDGEVFQGALYFGPRVVKDETHDVLEVYLLDFSGEVRADSVEFLLKKYIRGVLDFPNLDELKKQVAQDIEDVREALV